MENASKALIIAGAILLAILIISLGIMIYTQASNAINNGGMSDAETTAFNQRFTKYNGRQKGSTIRTLVQEVMSNNNNDQASNATRISINVANDGAGNTPATGGNAQIVSLAATAGAQPNFGTLQNTVTYTVSFQYHNGRVAVICIS